MAMARDKHPFVQEHSILNQTSKAIVALKKGAHILKYSRRGKPKLCPFRLSTDERTLMWFSGKEERQLQLSSVTGIVRGHATRKLQSERECHSFSLIYMNNQAQCSLDLTCKDKLQADSWFLGLKALISRYQNLGRFEIQGGAQSCITSPASFIRRKYNLGLSKEIPKISQVRSVSGSPNASLSKRCFSDGLSFPSDSFYSGSTLSSLQGLTGGLVSSSPCIKPQEPENNPKKVSRFFARSLELHPKPKRIELSDVLIWGEGVENEALGGGRDHTVDGYQNQTRVDALLPKVLDSVSMLDVEIVSLAGTHAALVTKQGEVFCWGEGRAGRLRHGITCPKEVELLRGINVKSVSSGEYQTCALTFSGELYTWGENCDGQSNWWLPRRVSGVLDGISVSKVACGEWHTAVVSTSGQLYTFGDGTFGVLGHGNCQSLTQPKQVESLKGLRVKSVACGPWHMAAVVEIMTNRCKSSTQAGKLFTWGDGDKGRLGQVDHKPKVKPTCVAQLIDHDFVQVSCGRMLTVGLTSTGVVYAIGSSVHGQLGNPQARDKSITVVQGKLKFEFVREIASGSYHVAVLTSKGSVYTWGKGANGQLGVGDTMDRSSPTFVEALRHRQVQTITCGSNSTAAVCLHKPITCGMGQPACQGCSIEFGFMRKKHNCYNCGLSFCSTCSRKKTKNACLAPVESKSFRVCDSCFKGLERSSSSSSQMPLLLTKTFSGETDQHMATPKPNKPRDKSRWGSDCDFDLDSPLMSRAPRWGQVSSPASFRKHCKEDSTCISVHTNENSREASQQRVEPRVKCNPTKDVIKALTSRLHSMSPRASARKQAKAQVDAATTNAMHSTSSTTHMPSDVEVREANSLCESTVVSAWHNNAYLLGGDTRPTDEPVAKLTLPGAKQKHEWMEQYQPGVYITFIMLPTGQKGIKRVRFSRKVFKEKEAERWWEDNQQKVYDRYDVDGYINSY